MFYYIMRKVKDPIAFISKIGGDTSSTLEQPIFVRSEYADLTNQYDLKHKLKTHNITVYNLDFKRFVEDVDKYIFVCIEVDKKDYISKKQDSDSELIIRQAP